MSHSDYTVVIDLPNEADHVPCPIPTCGGHVMEADTGIRWNPFYVEDGVLKVTQEYGEWAGEGFVCSHCTLNIEFTTDPEVDYL